MNQKLRHNSTERDGIYSFSKFVSSKYNWIIREQSTSDVGVDLIIECVDAYNNPNGLLIGVQVKSGAGNFHETKKYFTRYVEEEHYYYWLKIKIPMIIVFYNPQEDSLYWEKINSKTLVKTKKKYKLNIPKYKKLESRESLEKFWTLNSELSDINSLIQNIDAAQIVYKNSIEYDPKNTDALNQYALILTENNFFIESMNLLNKAYKIDVQKSGNGLSEKTITRKLNFAKNLLHLGRLEWTKKIVVKCEQEAKSILPESNYLFSIIYNYYGQINRSKNKIDLAISNCKKALEHSKVNGNTYEWMISLSNLSEMYIEKAVTNKLRKNYLYQALYFQMDALRLCIKEEETFINRIDIILSKIGVTFYYLKDFNRSIEYYQDSLTLQIKRLGENNIRIANRYNNLSNSYASNSNFKASLEYNKKAIEINIANYKTDKHYEIANLYFNRALQYLKNENQNKGVSYLEKWNEIINYLQLPIDRFMPSLNKAIKEAGVNFKPKKI